MAAPKSENTECGWNDPPVFDYHGASNISPSEQSRRTQLNKRVAYPISSETSNTTDTATLLNPMDGPPRLPPVHILPPMATTTTPSPVPLVVPTISPTEVLGESSLQPAILTQPCPIVPGSPKLVPSTQEAWNEKSLQNLMDELSLQSEDSLLEYIKEGLHSAADSVKHSLQGRAFDEVKKKLTMMEDWWRAGKLSETVKSRLTSLATAVKQECLEEAHELHLALMINHTTEVHHWLVGIKHIIQELQTSALGPGPEPGNDQDQSKPSVDPCLALETMVGLQPEGGASQGSWALSGPTQVQDHAPGDHLEHPELTQPNPDQTAEQNLTHSVECKQAKESESAETLLKSAPAESDDQLKGDS